MRIQFGTWIQSCDFVSIIGKSIQAKTGNGLYTIIFEKKEDADAAYKQLLEKGYYDASNNEYSNVL